MARDTATGSASRVGMNLGALVIARVAGLALSLIQSGIIFRSLSVDNALDETGVFGYTLAFASFFTVFATFGIQRLLVRDIARDPSIAWTQAWTALGTITLLSLLCLGAIGLSLVLVNEPFGTVQAALLAGASVVFLWAVQQPFESLLVARERMGLVALVYFIVSVLKLASVFVVMRGLHTAAAAHGAILIANAIGFVVMAAIVFRVCGWERPRFRPALAMAQVQECLPFAAAMLFSLAYFKSDMLMLRHLADEAAAGQYTPAQRLMEPLLMVAALWGTAVFPALCRLAHTAEDQYRQLKTSSVRMALIAAFPMAAGLALLAEPVVALLAGDADLFHEAVGVLRILACVVPFFYLNSLGQEFFYAAHRNGFVVVCYAAAAAVSIGGNLIAIPLLGVAGVGGVALAANGLISVLFLAAMRRELGGMHLPTLIAKIAAACAGMGVVTWIAAPYSLVGGVIAGGVVYAALIWILRAFNPLEQGLVDALLLRVPGLRVLARTR